MTPPVAAGDACSGRTFSRRQALGRMSVAASAGAAAWVVPEILTAKPAAGATLSGNHTTPPGGGSSSNPTTSPSSTDAGTTTGSTPATLASASSPATSPGSTLAFTGIDIQRDAEIGAALIAGGWAMHHWASRTPKPATGAHEAGSQVDPT
ncbi:MAG TPA: hypothetical protein VK773_01255 [Acidimicrobiales bacterium]|nr:hypothetical protein [Acidimicrobiales bacterium]